MTQRGGGADVFALRVRRRHAVPGAPSSEPHVELPHSVPRLSAVAPQIAPAARVPWRMRRGALRASVLCESHETAEVQHACVPAGPHGWQTLRSVWSWPLRLQEAAEASHQLAEPLKVQSQSPASLTAHRASLHGRGVFLRE